MPTSIIEAPQPPVAGGAVTGRTAAPNRGADCGAAPNAGAGQPENAGEEEVVEGASWVWKLGIEAAAVLQATQLAPLAGGGDGFVSDIGY